MKTEKERLFELLTSIQTLIEENENPDGTFNFDAVRAEVALDFTRAEIEKTILK